MDTFTEYLTFNLGSRVRREKLEGRDHIVVPTVMIVEGVLHGSNGPLYYPASELSSSAAVWNHKPLVVGHPGTGKSACEPAELNARKVGVLLNTRWDAPKLRTEAWIDKARAKSIEPRIIERLESSRQIEVSTGVRINLDSVPGVHNGRDYTAVARNYRPDHLAILLDAVGACSIADGAGMLQLNHLGLTHDQWLQLCFNELFGVNRPPVLLPDKEPNRPTMIPVYNSNVLLPGTLVQAIPALSSQTQHHPKIEPLPKPVWNWDKKAAESKSVEERAAPSGEQPLPKPVWNW